MPTLVDLTDDAAGGPGGAVGAVCGSATCCICLESQSPTQWRATPCSVENRHPEAIICNAPCFQQLIRQRGAGSEVRCPVCRADWTEAFSAERESLPAPGPGPRGHERVEDDFVNLVMASVLSGGGGVGGGVGVGGLGDLMGTLLMQLPFAINAVRGRRSRPSSRSRSPAPRSPRARSPPSWSRGGSRSRRVRPRANL